MDNIEEFSMKFNGLEGLEELDLNLDWNYV